MDALTQVPDESGDQSVTDYTKDLREKMSQAHEKARRNIKASQQRQKRNYDRYVAGRTIKSGMFVWLHNSARKKGLSPKLQFKWKGPYLVTDRLSDMTYRIQEKPKSKPKVVHYDKLKLYVGPALRNWRVKPRVQQEKHVENQENEPLQVSTTAEDELESSDHAKNAKQSSSIQEDLPEEADEPATDASHDGREEVIEEQQRAEKTSDTTNDSSNLPTKQRRYPTRQRRRPVRLKDYE